jgi:hypothetical protein
LIGLGVVNQSLENTNEEKKVKALRTNQKSRAAYFI